MAYWIDETDPIRYSGTSRQVSFYIDTSADVASLPGINRRGVQQGDNTVSCQPVGPGSSALCIGSGTLFILNSEDVWVEV
jgi:hypothetical protein